MIFSNLLATFIILLIINIWTIFDYYQLLTTNFILLIVTYGIRSNQDRRKAIELMKSLSPKKSRWQKRVESLQKKETLNEFEIKKIICDYTMDLNEDQKAIKEKIEELTTQTKSLLMIGFEEPDSIATIIFPTISSSERILRRCNDDITNLLRFSLKPETKYIIIIGNPNFDPESIFPYFHQIEVQPKGQEKFTIKNPTFLIFSQNDYSSTSGESFKRRMNLIKAKS